MNGEVAESRALTGLRGVAALLVMVHHFYLHLALGERLPLLQWLFRKGYLGVDIFFMLSGFVLCMVYGAWFGGTARIRWRDCALFWVRRVARIWPLHAAVVLLTLLLAALPHWGPDWGHVPGMSLPATWRTVLANLTMVQAWGLSLSINPPSWSVSTEFGAYLLFPALAALGLRSRAGTIACAVLAVALLTYCLVTAPPLGPARRGWLDLYRNYSVLPLLRCGAGVLLGLVCWRLGQVGAVARLAARGWVGPGALLLFAVLAAGRVNDLVLLALVPPMLLGLHFGRGWGHDLLGRGILHGLGTLSYASYLVHVVILDDFPFGLAPLPLALPLFLVVTLGWAALLHRLVEEPARRAIRAGAERALQAGAGSPK